MLCQATTSSLIGMLAKYILFTELAPSDESWLTLVDLKVWVLRPFSKLTEARQHISCRYQTVSIT